MCLEHKSLNNFSCRTLELLAFAVHIPPPTVVKALLHHAIRKMNSSIKTAIKHEKINMRKKKKKYKNCNDSQNQRLWFISQKSEALS